ncbi:MAG: bifunctional UDP-N-acetylglucosamine diphosphorylase/glucosamine-1-phosphate N-acetyltransferase GlmU [Nevskiaceae bacterium]|nr:bifunctional UDP-N-acetylglucosamine diphosphorylase/glucosamine-1-phosphate N-acetyltransferase GlmU [Nevskiaceae bacterium]
MKKKTVKGNKPAPLSIVVLAAGQGKRMNSALPKVLQDLAGQPLLRHVLDTARALSPAALYVVIGHGGEAVRAAFDGQAVSWVLQAEQKGTGHAVQQAMPSIPDDHLVLVLYGDVPLLRVETLRALIAEASARQVALLTVELADPAGYGRVIRDARGRVKSIVEQRDASPRQQRVREGNTGVLAAPAGLLRRWLARLRSNNAQGEFYLTDVIAMAVRDGLHVAAQLAGDEAEVLGVNDRQQLAQLEAVLRARRAQAALRAGVTLADPLRFDQRGELQTGRDVRIDINVVLEGRVELGDDVRIGPGCVLRDVKLGAGTVVHAHSVLEQCVVEADCVIGPFARLRPGAHLETGAHVGNYVEIKNATLGAGSKANHLTYLGDATVGSGVNVGAGTITCNYDGANKWRTEIGAGAFIGSGSMLVAPVKIGEGATIAAGSTITKEAPAGKLTVARSRQVSIEDWQRPVKNSKRG